MAAAPVCAANALVELSEDGIAWSDISAFVGRVDPGARERPLLEFVTFTGSKSCVGPASNTEIELEFLYTHADNDPFAILRDCHFAGTTVSLRWQADAATGAKQWVAAEATVPTWDEPSVDASADTPLTVLATLSVSEIDWVTPAP